MMLSSSAVDHALGIQTGNHFSQSQDGRKPPRDGFPRVIPIGFWWNGTDIVVCTAPTAPKVKALGERPNVALTIDDWAAGEGAPGTRRREDRDRRRRCAGVPRGRGQVDERRPTRHI